MASIHCPRCGAQVTVLSTHENREGQLAVELESNCPCFTSANARINSIRPAAVPDSTPEPQHRTTQF